MRFVIALAAAAGCLAATCAGAQEIPVSRWGAEDEIGAANHLSPAKVQEAVKLVTTGKTYALGIPIDRGTPAFPPRNFAVTVMAPNQPEGVTFGANKMSYLDDMVTGWLGVGTQIDGLAHLGTDSTFYNRNRMKDIFDTTGVKKLGAHKIPPIVTRGVLLDVAKAKGKDRLMEGELVTVDDIKAAEKAAGVTPGKGDVVVLHTGWLSMLGEDAKRFGAGEPGIDAEGARYLAGKDVVAVGADTWGVEAVPFKGDRVWEGHQILLAQNGIYILETLDTRALIRDGVSEFLFVLGAPRYVGSIQAIINPVAIR
ncbi:cyclase family protein [Methylobacterium nonmethylotrophicum]|uniref:Cyclase family protein n=1 Tax=Methylobacterium nonmethylotrophicum TaxID=1141884 RepID=A0A4Z0NU72_9HYPH|nr:cyclase family protein [Methylobacterium nonmethylotrophicum]TGD99796.1 cyclase family protein [Methylobacterium nonmethylotrophicum]